MECLGFANLEETTKRWTLRPNIQMKNPNLCFKESGQTAVNLSPLILKCENGFCLIHQDIAS